MAKENPKEMLNEAIAATKRMFEKILADEEGHLNDFEGMLEGM